jgi:hypothetical protein
MMERSIYNSSNEDGLLKSFGPYRVMTADKSFAGIKISERIEVASPVVVGEIKVYKTAQWHSVGYLTTPQAAEPPLPEVKFRHIRAPGEKSRDEVIEEAAMEEGVRPDVIASLNRSLKEHADVWTELSKY